MSPTDRLLTLAQLRERGINYSRVHLARLEKKGTFPTRLRPSERRIGWLESEISAWMKCKAAARNEVQL
jgi:prophage regulatory protein